MIEHDMVYNLCSFTHRELEAEIGQSIPLDKMQDWMKAIKQRLAEALVDDLEDLLDPDYDANDPELQRLLKVAHDAEEAKDAAYAAAFQDPACKAIVDKCRDAKDAAYDVFAATDARKAYRDALDAADAEHKAAMAPFVGNAIAAHDKAVKEFRDYQGRKMRPAITDTNDDFEYVSKRIVRPDGTVQHVDFLRQPALLENVITDPNDLR